MTPVEWDPRVSIRIVKTFIRPIYEYVIAITPITEEVIRKVESLERLIFELILSRFAGLGRHTERLRELCGLPELSW